MRIAHFMLTVPEYLRGPHQAKGGPLSEDVQKRAGGPIVSFIDGGVGGRSGLA